MVRDIFALKFWVKDAKACADYFCEKFGLNYLAYYVNYSKNTIYLGPTFRNLRAIRLIRKRRELI